MKTKIEPLMPLEMITFITDCIEDPECNPEQSFYRFKEEYPDHVEMVKKKVVVDNYGVHERQRNRLLESGNLTTWLWGLEKERRAFLLSLAKVIREAMARELDLVPGTRKEGLDALKTYGELDECFNGLNDMEHNQIVRHIETALEVAPDFREIAAELWPGQITPDSTDD